MTRLRIGLCLPVYAKDGYMILTRHWKLTDGERMWVDRRGLD